MLQFQTPDWPRPNSSCPVISGAFRLANQIFSKCVIRIPKIGGAQISKPLNLYQEWKRVAKIIEMSGIS